MKKSVIIALLFVSVLLVCSIVQAQELNQTEEQTQEQEQTQLQTYSGFNRFIDNIRLAFSRGDNKVQLALEIREKEVNSAMNHIQNDNEDKAIKNLENARKKLQIVQEKVSVDMADEVETSVEGVLGRLEKIETEEFKLYKLEEEKTQLTAELVVEVEGKEGQTLTREVVRNEGTGENEVMVVVEGGIEGQIQEQTRTREIEMRMGEINDEIEERVVEIEMAKEIDSGNNVVDDTIIDNGGDGSSGGNVVDDDVAPGPQGFVGVVEGDGPGDEE